MHEFLKNPLINNAAKMVSSNILMYLLPFFVTPILSRIYDPSMFGEWGVFSSTFQILNVILFLCYDYTIVKVSEKEYPISCKLCIFLSIAIVLIVACAIAVGNYLELSFIKNFPSKVCFIIILLVSAATVILQNIANREQRYWVLSISSVILGLSQAICRIFLGFFCIFPNGLIAGTTIAQIICVIYLFIFVGDRFRKGFLNNSTLKDVYSFAKKYKKFPLFDAPAALLTFATFNLSLIILSIFYSKSEIGCLSIIHQMLLLPISLVGGALGKVYYQQITSSDLRSENEMVAISQKMLKIVLYMSIVPTLFLVLGGDSLICIFLGSKWSNAGNIAICMSIWSIPNILTQPMIPIFRHLGKQNVMLYYNILNFTLAVGSLIVLCNLGANIYITLIVYSWLSAVANYMMFFSIVKLSKVKVKNIANPLIIASHLCTIVVLLLRTSGLI